MKCLKMFFVFCFLSSVFCGAAFAKTLTPVGEWLTPNKPKSIVQIYQCGDLLCGKVKQVIDRQDAPSRYFDWQKQSHPGLAVGQVFLTGFKQSSKVKWTGGKILDPTNGKIYRCKLTLIDQGQKLKVRGYIGISLFGRTQIWTRR